MDYPPGGTGFGNPTQNLQYCPLPSSASYSASASGVYPPTTSYPLSPAGVPYVGTSSSPGTGPYPPASLSPYPVGSASPYSPATSGSYPPTDLRFCPSSSPEPYPQGGIGVYSLGTEACLPRATGSYPTMGTYQDSSSGPGSYPYTGYYPSGGICPSVGMGPYSTNASPSYPQTMSLSYPTLTSASCPAAGYSTYPASSPYKAMCSVPHQSLGPSPSGSLWPYRERPTVRPAVNFDPNNDVFLLRKAMKGIGTDEATIIGVLARRTSYQRQEILMKYKQAFGRDLIRDLESELSGHFREVMCALMLPMPLFLARELHDAIVGLGTNEATLIEILCTRDNESLRTIRHAYQQQYGHPLEKDLMGDTSGHFRRLLVSMCNAYRDESTWNPALAPSLAQQLYKAGEGKLGTNEAEFNSILSTYSYPMLRCVFNEYHKLYGRSFEQALHAEFSGDIKQGLLALYHSIQNRAVYFARELHKAMAGAGTRDSALIRIIVSRSEIDLGNIKDEYYRNFGRTLDQAIKSETSGDYKRVILAILEE